MPLSERSGSVPDLGWESRPPGLVLPPFSKLSLEDKEIGRGELRGRRHRPSACASRRHPVPHACRRDTLLLLPLPLGGSSSSNRTISFCSNQENEPTDWIIDVDMSIGQICPIGPSFYLPFLNTLLFPPKEMPIKTV
jgi:hypothetical protein